MKKLLALSLSLLFVLAACGDKLEGTYKDDKSNTTIQFRSADSNDVKIDFQGMKEVKGKVNKDKHIMAFKEDGEEIKLKYKLDGDKLKIEKAKYNGKEEDGDMVLKKK